MGSGGGFVLLGQLQCGFDCEVVTVLTDCGSLGLAIAGKSRGMRLTSAHASLLRNSLSVMLVTYTICRECLSSPLSVFPDSLSMVAPSISMLCLSAACIFKLTGMRSSVVILSFLTTLRPARHL